MWRDPIVEEIRRYRQEYAARFNHDLKAICRDLRERQMQGGRKVVSLPSRRVERAGTPNEQPAARHDGSAPLTLRAARVLCLREWACTTAEQPV